MTSELTKYRNDFPVLKEKMNGKPLAFLDSGASAQKPQVVIDAMNEVLERGYSNIHRGLYAISQDLTANFEAVRVKIANFIGANSENEIVFTKNATESINLIANSWGRANLKAGDEVIISTMEHHANIVPWQLLANQIGFEIKVIPVDARGVLDMDAYQSLLSEKTKLVSVVHVSNALGTLNPVKDIVQRAKAFNEGIKVVVDGSQAVVHGAVNVRDIGADFYVFTGHKLYGPSGIGVLYGRSEVLADMPPFLGGGDMIERVSFDGTTFKEPPFRFEAGTPPIVEVIGLGAAVDYLVDVGMDNIAKHEASLLSYAMEQLVDISGLTVHGTAPEKAGIISFTMDDVHSSDMGMILDQCGVAVRAGHHCCMPLMQAMGVDATVRASFGLYTNKDDIDQFVAGLRKVQELFS